MRRWMRDRGKRRKQQSNEVQPQEKPEPLQPRFPDPQGDSAVADESGGMEAVPSAEHAHDEGSQEAAPESEQTQSRAQRSRRRGRRGRGSRQQAPAQASALPTPGGPTGE